MKNIFSLLILFIFSQQVVSQTTEESISEIRKMYKETENVLKNCRIIKSLDWVDEDQYEGYTPEITAYYDSERKEIIKVTEYGGGDWHESKISYYLRDGLLFFVFIESNYADEMYTAEELNMTDEELFESGGEAKTMLYAEGRIYLAKELVIRNLIKEKVISASSESTSLKDVDNVEEKIDPDNYEDLISHLTKMLNFLKTKI